MQLGNNSLILSKNYSSVRPSSSSKKQIHPKIYKNKVGTMSKKTSKNRLSKILESNLDREEEMAELYLKKT